LNARESGRLEVGGRSRSSVGASVTLFSRSGRGGELTGNAAVLLAWVALEGHADRCRVSATLWPESDAAQARSNLRVLTHRINQRFGSDSAVHCGSLSTAHLSSLRAVD
jgi:DNA-binding SARP family transcriptional activator